MGCVDNGRYLYHFFQLESTVIPRSWIVSEKGRISSFMLYVFASKRFCLCISCNLRYLAGVCKVKSKVYGYS